jgi:hypothetical protein
MLFAFVGNVHMERNKPLTSLAKTLRDICTIPDEHDIWDKTGSLACFLTLLVKS